MHDVYRLNIIILIVMLFVVLAGM